MSLWSKVTITTGISKPTNERNATPPEAAVDGHAVHGLHVPVRGTHGHAHHRHQDQRRVQLEQNHRGHGAVLLLLGLCADAGAGRLPGRHVGRRQGDARGGPGVVPAYTVHARVHCLEQGRPAAQPNPPGGLSRSSLPGHVQHHSEPAEAAGPHHIHQRGGRGSLIRAAAAGLPGFHHNDVPRLARGLQGHRDSGHRVVLWCGLPDAPAWRKQRRRGTAWRGKQSGTKGAPWGTPPQGPLVHLLQEPLLLGDPAGALYGEQLVLYPDLVAADVLPRPLPRRPDVGVQHGSLDHDSHLQHWRRHLLRPPHTQRAAHCEGTEALGSPVPAEQGAAAAPGSLVRVHVGPAVCLPGGGLLGLPQQRRLHQPAGHRPPACGLRLRAHEHGWSHTRLPGGVPGGLRGGRDPELVAHLLPHGAAQPGGLRRLPGVRTRTAHLCGPAQPMTQRGPWDCRFRARFPRSPPKYKCLSSFTRIFFSFLIFEGAGLARIMCLIACFWSLS
ncbi:uncharacterized protein LOC144142905 isoform X1 [Haemaphysalis longicornis]